MRHSQTPCACVSVLLAALTLPSAGLAQEAVTDPEIDLGVSLRRQGRDAEALAAFARAWERAHTPRARAQMALAEQALGRWSEAQAHLREALVYESDPWILRNRAALDSSLAEISRHAPPDSNAGAPATTDGPSRGVLQTAGIAGLVVGGAALAGGVTAWILRESAAARYNDDGRCARDDRSRDAQCPGERDTVETLTVLAGVGVGVGAAVAAAGAVLVVLSTRIGTTARVALWPGGAGLTLTGAF